jgi:hypothetical protein
MKPPNGLAEIKATFGNINVYINSDGTLSPDWELENIGVAHLAFGLALSWAPTTLVTKARCHKLLVPIVEELFSRILNEGLLGSVKSFGGCYMYRPQRGSHKISTHSWGIALDLNPQENEMGTPGTMDVRVVQLAESLGFFWGGNFEGPRRDPMHFQFCTGY